MPGNEAYCNYCGTNHLLTKEFWNFNKKWKFCKKRKLDYDIEYRKRTREKRLLQNRNRHKKYRKIPKFKLRQALGHRLYMALKHKKKKNVTLKYLGCTIQEFINYLESKFYTNKITGENMSWDNYGPKWHVDHIKPICSFNIENEEELKICFHYTNLQPLWAEENFKKHTKIINT